MPRRLRIGHSAASFFRGLAYVLGLNATAYYLGWTGAENAVSYSYSTDNGGSWTSTGTTIWAAVTGKTASTLYHCKVRAYDSSGIYDELTLDVTTKGVSDPVTIVSVIGTGTNPYTGGACNYASPDLWEADLNALAGSSSLVTGNCVLEGWLASQQFLNTPCVIEGATTSATCYRHLTAGPGQSFRDPADRRTARLGYDTTRGASMRYNSVSSLPTVDLREGFARVSRLQIYSAGNGTSTFGGWGIHTSSSTNPVYVDQCFVVSGTTEFVLSANYGPHYITDSIFVNNRTNSTPDNIAEENNGVVHTNCIFIAVGNAPPVATVARTGPPGPTPWCYFTDCALFGATNLHDVHWGKGTGGTSATAGTGTPVYSNSFTDSAQCMDITSAVVGLPSGVTQIAVTGLFESTSSSISVMDFRPRSGSALLTADITGCW